MNERTSFPLSQIYFYLTDGCNLSCRHCWLAPQFVRRDSPRTALELDLFKSIVDQAHSLRVSGVKLTGGEPLIHPDIKEMLCYVRETGMRLTMETNGVCCTQEIAELINACTDPFVSVSLDGANAETHEWMRRVEGCFEDALAGFRNLVNVGLRPQIIMSLSNRNKDQTEAVLALAESLGAGSVKFNVIQPSARGKLMRRDGEALTIEELVSIGHWVENELCESASIPVFFGHPTAFRPLSRMFGSSGDGCGICGILGIIGVLSDGSYALCGIGELVPSLVFGDAAKDLLSDVWDNSPTLLELRDGLPKRLQGICHECLMKGICLGSCIAQNSYAARTLWAPYWYCEEADKRGLFPESRRIGRPQ